MPELITVVQARGIGEPLAGPTMCGAVTDSLPRDRFRIVNVRHRSEYGPVPALNGQAYEKTKRQAKELALAEIMRTRGLFVLLGYSGGADAMGDLADEIGRGLLGTPSRARMLAAALIADPKNPRANLTQQQWGVAGSRLIHTAAPIWRANDPADVIPFCDGNSPIRTIADQTEGASLVDPAAWVLGLYLKLRAQQFQQVAINWRDPASVKAIYDKAVADFNGYRTGQHTSYNRRQWPGTGRTYTAELTHRIAGLAT